jgi:hypothetical protein
VLEFAGGPSRDRTGDLLIKSHIFYLFINIDKC